MLSSHRLVAVARWRIALASITIGCCLILGSCAAGIRPASSEGTQNQSRPSFRQTALPEVTKLLSAAGDFLPMQPGADFAADLANNRCSVQGPAAVFSPVYAAPDRALTDAAYCLYRLELDGTLSDATLKINWESYVPANSDCWVGIANWQRGSWDWRQPGGSTMLVTNPADYATSEQHCYVALVLLGKTSVELRSIGFGNLTPTNPGYTLYSPMEGYRTFLIDEAGTAVHTWQSEYRVGANAQLDVDGTLLRLEEVPGAVISGGGFAGRLARFSWDGDLIWSYELCNETECTHHDFDIMPNGNILLIVWNKYTMEQQLAAGRNPDRIYDAGIFADAIYEIAPTKAGADIVWRWYSMDHLVQDYDDKLPNYSDPAIHPELIDINYQQQTSDDWLHVNAVDYNPELDQIVISVLCMCELWVIDHSTTTEEAASHSGGRCGHGGDLLYRWGNPAAYRHGLEDERALFGQHNVHWIEPGLPGAGNLMIFNNGANRPGGSSYSSVLEITPPLNQDGNYTLTAGKFGPDAPTWEYVATPPEDMFSANISSAQRLRNGNTLICCGRNGTFIEINPANEIVWEYSNTIPSNNWPVFRAIRYEADYPGLSALVQ